jgi:hypothetical protein
VSEKKAVVIDQEEGGIGAFVVRVLQQFREALESVIRQLSSVARGSSQRPTDAGWQLAELVCERRDAFRCGIGIGGNGDAVPTGVGVQFGDGLWMLVREDDLVAGSIGPAR